MARSIGVNRSIKRIGSLKRIGKVSKVLTQILGLVSVRKPLGVLQFCVRGFLKRFRSPGPVSNRRVSFSPTSQPDLNLDIVSPMGSMESGPHASPGPESMICCPGTEDEASPVSSRRSLVFTQGGVHQNEVGSARQRDTTFTGSLHHSMVGNREQVASGWSHWPESQSRPYQRLLQGVLMCASPESSAREVLHRNMEVVLMDGNLSHSEKVSRVCTFWGRFHDSQLAQANSKVTILEDERSTLLKRSKEIDQDRQIAQKRTQELEGYVNDYQKSYVGVLQREARQRHDEIVSLTSELADLQKISQEHKPCANIILSLNATVEALQRISQEHESYVKSKSEKPELYAHNIISGSYADESATPVHLHNAWLMTKISGTKFQKAFVDAVNSIDDPASIVDLLAPDVFFARPSHVYFAARMAVYEAFFDGFENESFNTCLGVTKFLDPDVRKVKFYEYYLNARQQNDTGGICDPQFEAFCETKLYLLCKKFNLRCESNTKSLKMSHLEKVGGPRLVSAFRAAAKNIWLFHKLAFSFQPPASIFRVEQRAIVDTNYMHLMVNLDDHKRFVHEVGFMITPGFRVGNSVLPCEVYLASAG